MTSITVHWNPWLTSHNKRKHWRAHRKLVEQAHEEARLGWLLAGSPRWGRKVRVSVHRRGSRVMDTLNILDGLKPLVDAIFTSKGCGALPDDSPEWLELGSISQEKCKRGDECVIFSVEEIA